MSLFYRSDADTFTDNWRLCRRGHRERASFANSRSTDDQHATNEPDGNRGADSDVQRDGSGHSAVKLSVAEERGQHLGGDVEQLHDAGDRDLGQWVELHGSGDEQCGERDQ